MYSCKHCNKQVPSSDDIPIHDCFTEKEESILKENNNVLFYAENEREYTITREFYLFYFTYY